MFRKNSQQGFSLVEVVVASVIFALVVGGIFAALSSVREPAAERTEEVMAGFLAKQTLDNLRSAVDASVWESTDTGVNPLVEGSTYTDTQVINDGTKSTSYTITYSVRNDPISMGRYVDLNVTW